MCVLGSGKRGSGLNSTVKQVSIWIVMIVCMLVAYRVFVKNMEPGHNTVISMTTLQNSAEQGKISDVTVSGNDVSGKFKDGKETFTSTIPSMYPDFYNGLRQHGVNVNIKDPQGNMWIGALGQFLPGVVLLGLFLFMMRRMQSGGDKGGRCWEKR